MKNTKLNLVRGNAVPGKRLTRLLLFSCLLGITVAFSSCKKNFIGDFLSHHPSKGSNGNSGGNGKDTTSRGNGTQNGNGNGTGGNGNGNTGGNNNGHGGNGTGTGGNGNGGNGNGGNGTGGGSNNGRDSSGNSRGNTIDTTRHR